MIDCTLDTTALVDIARGKGPPVPLTQRYSAAGLSHVALGELLLGALKSSNPQLERQKILRIIRGMTLLQGDQNTSDLYASIRYDLERRGTLIPQNDIWIAAASIQANVPLITRDKHFRTISSLKLEEY